MTPSPPIEKAWDPLHLVEFRTDCEKCGRAIEPGDFRTAGDLILCSACAACFAPQSSPSEPSSDRP
jgi:hypothetical protein